LFPFLAVLICTMGALIVLLVLVVQQARVNADTITEELAQQNEEKERAERTELLEEQEDLVWRREILEQQRTELTGRVADQRLELSHLEEHIRRLEERWKLLQVEAAELEKLRDAGGQNQASIRSKLARIEAEIAAEQKRLAQARQEAAKRQQSFTIIAYRGPNGTRRRPIYIECKQSGIVIHPEEVVLQAADFSGPLGPGNPLDAALRTIREHWARIEDDASQGEPYPLLIVRPDGAVAYSMARAAMASWDDEFGYELVDADMMLNYPPGDPTLKRLLEATIKTARQRQSALAAAMPSRFDGAKPGDFTLREQRGGAADNPGVAGGQSRKDNGLGGGTGGSAGRPRGDQTPWTGQASRPGRDPSGNRPPGATARQGTAAGGPDGASAGSSGGPNGVALSSMAATKGANWALPHTEANSTGITRPIAIQCYHDRLVIPSDQNDRVQSRVIPVVGSVRGSIEQFVSAVWTHMDGWGMAVAGGYWKPVLKVWVAPDAETRFRELEILLKDSGVEVERK